MTPVEEFLQEDRVRPRHDVDVLTSGNVSINPDSIHDLIDKDKKNSNVSSTE